jgi:hypothetical protein
MDQPFDIFRKDVDGRVVWCGTAKSLAEAHAKIRGLEIPNLEFMVIDELTGEQTFIKVPSQKSA